MKNQVLGFAAAALVTTVLFAAPADARRQGWHMKKVCKTVWVKHHKVQKCRNVRVRW